MYLRAVLLVSDDFLDMDTPSSSVNGHYLALLVFDSVFNTAFKNFDGISHSNWKRSAIILGAELFAQSATHHSSSDAAWSCEMGLSRLSSLAGNTCNLDRY